LHYYAQIKNLKQYNFRDVSSVIDDVDDKHIVEGVPVKSIRHEIKFKQLFPEAGMTEYNMMSTH
jgi:hypothetical protein